MVDELIHYLNQKRNGKNWFMSLKLDMNKVFDRVRWDFLEALIIKIGLGSRLVNLIMYRVKFVLFSKLINGEVHNNILPSRGICQGDLLSTFLFLFCTKSLVSLLKMAEKKDIRTVRICR